MQPPVEVGTGHESLELGYIELCEIGDGRCAGRRRGVEKRLGGPWQDPGFERLPRGVGHEEHEIGCLRDDPPRPFRGCNEVVEEVRHVGHRGDFRRDDLRHEVESHELAVQMLERRAGLWA